MTVVDPNRLELLRRAVLEALAARERYYAASGPEHETALLDCRAAQAGVLIEATRLLGIEVKW